MRGRAAARLRGPRWTPRLGTGPWAPRRLSRIVGIALLAGVAALAIGGCVPNAVTAEGRQIEDLYRLSLGLGGAVLALVYALGVLAIVRYRRRPNDDELPEQVHGAARLEAIWTAIPIVTVLGLFAATLLVLQRTEAQAAQPAAEVRVEAFRWGWRFLYPQEGIEVTGIGEAGPEVVVPVGQPIRFRLTAADVNHAFYVPLFLFKRDMIPGRETSFDVTVEEPGLYGGQCAEHCGIGHAYMPFSVRAVSPEEYAAWLASQQAGSTSPPASQPLVPALVLVPLP